MSAAPCVTRSNIDSVAVVSPVGDFDLATVPLLRTTFEEALASGSDRVVVDLAATTFLDSVALGAVIGLARRLGATGGWVRLVAPRPNVRKVLRITGLDAVLGLYDTVDQAVAHSAHQPPA